MAHQTFTLLAAVHPLLPASDHLVAERALLHPVVPLAVATLFALGDAVLATALHADVGRP